MNNRLSAAQIDHYRRHGYVFPLPALLPAEAEAVRLRLEAFEAETGQRAGSLRKKGHLKLMAIHDLVSHPAILDAVESVIGPDILCWSTSLFVKDPHDPGFVAWHQDSHYWDLQPDDVVSAWIALAPSTLENGALRVIPGTHLTPPFNHRPSAADSANLLSGREEIAVDVDENQAVDLVLRQGEMSLHHVKIVHGSPPNRSAARRYGLAIRYVAPHVRNGDEWTTALLVRGRNEHGYFTPDPVPTRDMDPNIVEYVDSTWNKRR